MSDNIKTKKVSFEDAIKAPDFSFLDSLADVQDFAVINRETVRLILKMRKMNAEINLREVEKVKAQRAYDKAYREAYIKHEHAKNETHRKLLCEQECEELELKVVYQDVYIKQLTRLVQQAKIELDALKSLGFNIRQELQSI